MKGVHNGPLTQCVHQGKNHKLQINVSDKTQKSTLGLSYKRRQQELQNNTSWTTADQAMDIIRPQPTDEIFMLRPSFSLRPKPLPCS